MRLTAAVVGLTLLAGCGPRREAVTVFHAGSLSAFVREAGERFESNHPSYEVLGEASGSLDAVRKVSELGREADLLALADARLIERFLIPEYASKGTVFLGNEIVLATGRGFPLDSEGKLEQWREEWHRKLFSGNHSYGISDPDRDPAGYYAHLVWKLAEIHYQSPGLYQRFLKGFDERWMRPKSSELVALLQTGTLDFAFIYRSAALQNKLAFVRLPAEVSLGEEAQADRYSKVVIEVAGDAPEETFRVYGAPIRYGICRLNAAGPGSEQLLDFLLSPEARELARELGYKVVPMRTIAHSASRREWTEWTPWTQWTRWTRGLAWSKL